MIFFKRTIVFIAMLFFAACKSNNKDVDWILRMSYNDDPKRSVQDFIQKVDNGYRLRFLLDSSTNYNNFLNPGLTTVEITNSDTFYSIKHSLNNDIFFRHIFSGDTNGNKSLKENGLQIKEGLFKNICSTDFKKMDTVYYDKSEDSITAEFYYKCGDIEKRITVTPFSSTTYKQIPKELIILFHRVNAAKLGIAASRVDTMAPGY